MKRYATLYERLVANTYEPIGDLSCWEWKGHIDAHGYPRINVREGGVHRKRRAHVLMAELIHGPIPKGWHVEHRCRNRACICPDHLEPVTQSINEQRKRDPWLIERGINDAIEIALTRAMLRSASPSASLPSFSPLQVSPDCCSVPARRTP